MVGEWVGIIHFQGNAYPKVVTWFNIFFFFQMIQERLDKIEGRLDKIENWIEKTDNWKDEINNWKDKM